MSHDAEARVSRLCVPQCGHQQPRRLSSQVGPARHGVGHRDHVTDTPRSPQHRTAVLRAGGRRRDGTSESRQQPQTLPAAPFSRAADRRTRLGQVPSDWDDCYPEAVTESDLNLNLNRANYHWHHDAAAMTVIRAVPPCPAPPPLSGAPAARGSECCHRKPECPPGPAAATQGSHSFRDSRSRS